MNNDAIRGAEVASLETEIDRLRKVDDDRHARVCADMARRVSVEQALLDLANGKRGPIDGPEARKLALKLGVPEWFDEMVTEKAEAVEAARKGGK